MADLAAPTLPSRDFDATERFYRALGFTSSWKTKNWMVLERGTLQLEFFPAPNLDPANNRFGCCLRLDDLDGALTLCRAAGIEERESGAPRLIPPRRLPNGMTMAFVVDHDGSMLRMIQNPK